MSMNSTYFRFSCIALSLHIYHINLVFYGHFDFNAAQHKFNNMQQCEKHKRGSGRGGNRTIRALAGPVCMKNLGHAIFFTRCPPSYLLPVAVTERHPVDESRKYVHTVWKLVATKWLDVLLRRWFYSMNKYSALLPVWWSIFCSKGKLQTSKLNR